MQYVAYISVMIITFSACFGVDTLLKHFQNRKPTFGKVKPQKRTAVFGIVLAFLGLAVALNFTSVSYGLFCGVIVGAMGVFLLVVYCGTTIAYDEHGFSYHTPLHRAKSYRYGDIVGQTALMTRSGVNTMLYVGNDEIHLYQSMEGLQDFLQTAYRGWLAEKNLTEEECPPPNPTYYQWFAEV